ncbi:MAG: ATP-binding cassette domain-containing protein [Coprobacillus sp.]
MLEIKHLSKIYKSKNVQVRALDDINLQIQDKGMVFILGKSGSGKSTLLNVLGGLDQFSEGEIIICGKSSKDFKQSDFDSYRNTFIGFIFQEYNVMNNFTVKENIALALQLQGKKVTDQAIQDILDEVDLQDLGNRKPNELSGGQLQRVAIARALIKNPEIIMADEPTGALDSNTGKQVFDTLKKLSKDKLVLIVSHDKEFAKNYADRIIELADGKITSDTSKELIAPQQMNEGISFLENEFINIQNAENLTHDDIEKIIQELKKHNGETIISFNKNTNQEIKKTNHIDEEGRIEVFHDTSKKHLNLKDYASQSVNFIKSKLPFKSSMKLALSNLKLKPFRLFITIILSVVSFTLFGLTNTMSEYNKETTTFNSIKDSQIDYLSLGKTTKITYQGNYSYDEPSKLNSQDLEVIQKKYPQLKFINTFSSSNSGTSLEFSQYIENTEKLPGEQQRLFYQTYFSALSTINDNVIKEKDFSLTGNLPKTDKEIVVTEFFANTFKDFGYKITDSKGKIKTSSIQSSKDLIGKTLTLTINSQNIDFTISGILDTHVDLSRYEVLKEEHSEGLNSYYLTSELQTLLMNSYHSLGYVNDTRLQNSIDNYNLYSAQFGGQYLDLSIDDNYMNPECFYNFNDINKDKLVDFDNGGSFYVNYNTIKTLRVDKTITLQDYVSQRMTDPTDEKAVINIVKEAVKKYQSQIVSSKLVASLSLPGDHIDNIIDKIAGVYINDFNTESHAFVLKDKLIDKYEFSKSGYAEFVLSPMSDDETLKDVITYTYDDGIDKTSYTLNNQVMPMLTSVNSVVAVLGDVFFWVGIGFAVFAAIMFCNFIATSIANKKREIGILRAVGARGMDVLKIFLNESLIIALINWLLAVSACFAGTLFINQFIRNDFGVLVTVLNFGPLQIILLLVISIAVAFIASVLPVYKISRKKPVDAIKDR